MAEFESGLDRIVAKLIDSCAGVNNQFETLTKAVENLKIDFVVSINNLREDFRRTDDRSQKQIDDLKGAHQKEVDRLLNIIQTLLSKDSSLQPRQQSPPQSLFQQQQIQPSYLLQSHQQQQLSVSLQQNMQMYHKQIQEDIFNKMMGGVPQATSMIHTVQPMQMPQKTISVAAHPYQPHHASNVSQSFSSPMVAYRAPVQVQNLQNLANPPKLMNTPLQTQSVVAPPSVPVLQFPAVQPVSANSASIVPLKVNNPYAAISTPKTSNNPSSDISKKPESSVKPVAVEPPHPSDDKENEETDSDESEPDVAFKPLVPLPALIEVKTEEENEDILFEARSRLFIYDNDTVEWKDRGVGDIKILKDRKTKNTRVVMRREEILNVCANFQIISAMRIQAMANNDKALIWYCEDFSEDEPRHAQFSARFGDVEIAKKFKEVFEKAIDEHRENNERTEKLNAVEEKPCEEAIPSSKSSVLVKALTSTTVVSSSPGNVPNLDEISSVKENDENKESLNRTIGSVGKPISAVTPRFSFGQHPPGKEPLTPSFTFQARNVLSATPIPSFNSAVPPPPSSKPSVLEAGKNTPTVPSFAFTKPTNAVAPGSPFEMSPKCSFSSALDRSIAMVISPPSTELNQLPNLGVEKETKKEIEKVAPFNFIPNGQKLEFGNNSEIKKEVEPTKPEQHGSVFGKLPTSFGGAGTPNSGEYSFAAFAAKAKENNIFDGETSKKALEEFQNQRRSSVIGSDRNSPDDDDKANNEDYEPDVEYKPLIPLPALVEAKTGEEDEEVIFKARCKLFKYFNATNEYKERGVGDVKILRNNQNQICRVVMRREQVHKICANFRVTKEITMTVKSGMSNVFTFMCHDFSEDTTNGEVAVFTIKFKSESTAMDFKQKFIEVQKTV